VIAPCVLDTSTLLMAILPARGARATFASIHAVLKWAPAELLIVTSSSLEFLTADGRMIARNEHAFGLAADSRYPGPHVQFLSDGFRRPAEAQRQRWRLNDWTVEAPITLPTTESGGLHVEWLPLQVPLPDDIHVLAEFVNLSPQPLNMATGMREARCWVDGVALSSAAGGIWNGRYLIEPGRAAVCRFRLSDFPGISTTGIHEVAFEMLGQRSDPVPVRWHGTAWTGSSAENGTETSLISEL
jgi:hypothetical protein